MAEDTPKLPESLPDTHSTSSSGTGEQGGNPEPGARPDPEAPQLAPKDRRAARRVTSRPGGTAGPKTIEEREAVRLERRAHNAKLRRSYRARAKAKRDDQRAAAPVVDTPAPAEHGPGRPKVRSGVVVSDKADKTIVVRIDVVRRHRRYGKILRTSSKLHVHDERNDAGAGDTVRVVESRPLSALKRWRLVEVTEKAR